MRGKSLIKDVSVNELLALREQGLTNAEIAKKMDVHYTSVHRLIGPQPDGLRKKPGRKVKPLPPVGDKPIPEMPHKSFAERCEEMKERNERKALFAEVIEHEKKELAKAAGAILAEEYKCPKGKQTEEVIIRLPDDPKPCTLADLAREAHEKKMAEIKQGVTDDRSHVPELIAMFGPDAVTAWLKVSLYDMGIPDCRPMNRQKMLETLKIMNAGGASV